jgi:hypothetical protein
MFMRERSYGVWLWILNLAVHRVSGVQMRSMGSMRWGFEKISRGARRSFLAILVLRWVTAPKFNFSMTYGMGITRQLDLFSIARLKEAAMVD